MMSTTVAAELKSILILCSIIGLLNIASIQANLHGNRRLPSFHDLGFFFPHEEHKPKSHNEMSTLEIYTKKNIFGKPLKEDNRPIGKLAIQLDSFHKNLTSTIFANRPGENVIYSPISVSILLAMMTMGARGNTAKEIFAKTGLSTDPIMISGFTHLTNIFEKSEGVRLNFANQIFISDSIKIDPTYQKHITGLFHSKTEMLDFDNPKYAAEKINKWCKQQTNDLITDIVTPDDLEDVLMVLANAIYFQGDWEIPFDTKRTKIREFHVDNTVTVDVPMMHGNGNFNYGRIHKLKARFIELPYKQKKDTEDTFSMYLLVPNGADGLNLIEENLHLIDFKRLNNEKDNVNLYLPKFKIRNKLDIESILKKIGIHHMFDGTFADFRGITSNVNLHVDKMTQKAFLEINELGSTSAAATGTIFANRMLPVTVRVDKPFLCAIVIKSVGIPLFYARITDPTKFE